MILTNLKTVKYHRYRSFILEEYCRFLFQIFSNFNTFKRKKIKTLTKFCILRPTDDDPNTSVSLQHHLCILQQTPLPPFGIFALQRGGVNLIQVVTLIRTLKFSKMFYKKNSFLISFSRVQQTLIKC